MWTGNNINKLGLSCTKFRFSCASQLSSDNNVTTWTLEQIELIEPLSKLNPWIVTPIHIWTLKQIQLLNQVNHWTNETLVPTEPNWTSWTLEPNKLSNHYNPRINWTLKPIEPLNQLNPQTNWTLEPIESMVQLYVRTDWTLEPIEPLNRLNP